MIKTLSKARKQERVKFLIPRSVQDCIPIRRIWADGIFQVGHQFSKTWSFTDINYSIAGKDDKTAMFLDYCDLLNALASGASAKITLYNRRINKEEFERSVLLPLKEDGLDNYREEFNEMLRAQVTESNNSIVRERYLTISVVKRNIEEYQANNRTETANIASCEVIDDTHIKMMMAEPNSSTLESVGFFVYYMSPKALENPSSLDAATCGTGPFQLTHQLLPCRSARRRQSAVLCAGVCGYPVAQVGTGEGADAVAALKGDAPASGLCGHAGGHGHIAVHHDL